MRRSTDPRRPPADGGETGPVRAARSHRGAGAVLAPWLLLGLSGCAAVGVPRSSDPVGPASPADVRVRAQDPAEAPGPSGPPPPPIAPLPEVEAASPPLPSPTLPAGPSAADVADAGGVSDLIELEPAPAPPVVVLSPSQASPGARGFSQLSSIARNRLANRVPVAPESSAAGTTGGLGPRDAGGRPGALSSILRNRIRASGEEPQFDYPEIHTDPAARYHDLFGVEEEHDRFLFPWLMNLIFEDRWLLDEPDADQALKNQLRRRMKIDIRDPDPDTANFPNGAYTIPKGRVYIESSPLGLYGASRNGNQAFVYQWDFLLRYGLTDNLEFRIFSNGLTAQAGLHGKPGTTGFSPLAFDFKANFWEENTRYHIPAMGIEVYLQTTLGSPAFSAGTQPSINLLFDQSLPFGIGFEYNLGISGVQNAAGLIAYQFSFQWSFQREVVKDFDVFFHGFYNEAALPRAIQFLNQPNTSIPTVIVMGLGGIWTINDRLAVFGSYNLGATTASPRTLALMGFAVAL